MFVYNPQAVGFQKDRSLWVFNDFEKFPHPWWTAFKPSQPTFFIQPGKSFVPCPGFQILHTFMITLSCPFQRMLLIDFVFCFHWNYLLLHSFSIIHDPSDGENQKTLWGWSNAAHAILILSNSLSRYWYMYCNIVEECILVLFFQLLLDRCMSNSISVYNEVIKQQYLPPNFIPSMIWYIYLIPGIL